MRRWLEKQNLRRRLSATVLGLRRLWTRPVQAGVGLVIGVVALAWVLRAVNLAVLGASLATANIWWVLLGIAVYQACIWARAMRWQNLLRPVARPPVFPLFRYLAIGFTANLAVPGQAGEALRPVLLARRERVDTAKVLSSVVIEKLFDFGALLLMGIVLLVFVPSVFPVGLGALLWKALPILIGVLSAAALVVPRLPWRALAGRWKILDQFAAGFGALSGGKAVATTAGWTLAVWAIEMALYWCIGSAFGFQLQPMLFAALVAVVNLGTTIPSAPGSIGTFEALASSVLAPLVGAGQALAYAFVLHASLVGPLAIIGALFWFAETGRLRVPAFLSSLTRA